VLVPQPQCDNSLSDVVRDVTATTESLQPDEKSRETVSACGTEPGIESCSCPVSDTAAVCDDQTSKGNLLCNGPPGSVTSHDSEVGSESGSYTASEASAVKVTYNGTDTDAKSSESGNCVRQVPAAVMKSDDAEAGSRPSAVNREPEYRSVAAENGIGKRRRRGWGWMKEHPKQRRGETARTSSFRWKVEQSTTERTSCC